ncbi:MAG: magnesium transporter [Bacillales bacterium]|nr:magnesium transporter [Bacillales bacterium]MDY6002714.1 magnesium transporter [Bacilli bacterium]
MDENNKEEVLTPERLEYLIDNKKVKMIREIFETVPALDIAEVANEIEDVKKLVFLFKVVKSEYTADFYTELSSDTKENLIKTMSDDQLVDLLEDQFTDDIVDDIEDLPANLVYRVLKNVSKEKRKDINRLLNYQENTAGSIMTVEFLGLNQNLDREHALSRIRSIGRNKETVLTTFVFDNQRKMVGTLNLDDLIFARDGELVSDIMNQDFVTVGVNTDQEEVAQMFKDYDLNAIAVLNDDERLVGIITIDDIVDVIEEEATEDMSKLAGVTPLDNSYLETSVFKMALKCAPWLICLLVLGTFSSMILNKFEHALSCLPILVPFVTVLMDTGGNAGGQTTTLMVRGLAVQEFTPKDYFKIVWKELRVAVVTGLMVCFFACLWFIAEMYLNIIEFDGSILNSEALTGFPLFLARFKVAGLVSLTLFLGIIVAKFVGTSLPMLVASLKKDPALISSPFVTTIVDVCSLLIYLGFAYLIFGEFLGAL